MSARARCSEHYRFDARSLEQRGVHPRSVAEMCGTPAQHFMRSAIDRFDNRCTRRDFKRVANEKRPTIA